jgi:hypothetical protein
LLYRIHIRHTAFLAHGRRGTMIEDVLVDRTYRTRSGEDCKVIGIVGDLILFISEAQTPRIVEEMPRKLFAVCVVEEVPCLTRQET